MKGTKQDSPKHIIEIVRDDNPQNPREWDNGCVMLCNRGRRVLSDKHAAIKIAEIVRKHPKYDAEMENAFNEDDEENKEYLDMADHYDMMKMLNTLKIAWLPVYLYDHGGLSVNTTGFSCHWDSGQVGIIVIDPSEYGGDNAEDYLRNEVKVYDQYLTGDTYGVRIFEVCPCCGEKVEQIDANFGFLGDDFENNGAKEFICGEHGESQADFEAAVIRGARITN